MGERQGLDGTRHGHLVDHLKRAGAQDVDNGVVGRDNQVQTRGRGRDPLDCTTLVDSVMGRLHGGQVEDFEEVTLAGQHQVLAVRQ